MFTLLTQLPENFFAIDGLDDKFLHHAIQLGVT